MTYRGEYAATLALSVGGKRGQQLHGRTREQWKEQAEWEILQLNPRLRLDFLYQSLVCLSLYFVKMLISAFTTFIEIPQVSTRYVIKTEIGT